jgi:2-polyprenyl-3-methyl-5-hydroxy-6-metoxy-1,4-benzoquinol methylase/GNAT superfamily N-acetyltransferase
LDNKFSELWTVRDNGKLIGYAIALKGLSGSNEKVIWVTQFVIHKDYRNTGIGKRLLFSIWGLSDFFAWGLVTANPYAVRALEKATRRRCEPNRVKKNLLQLINFGKKHIGYINESTEKIITDRSSKINTNFYVDHSEIDKMLSNVTSSDKPWILDDIEDGWEWFAFTFNDQVQFELTNQEVETMLEASDSIAQEAYNRMLMNKPKHKWAAETKIEIDYIIKECELSLNDRILDVGCGMGRHTIELSKRGFDVIGIDYASSLIDSAKNKANEENVTCKFICGDITNPQQLFSNQSFDVILCLYDVVGSYADDTKNLQILKNISHLLKDGGFAIISVMNLHLTEEYAKNTFLLKESSKKLLELQASNTMETTGNIFNPDYYLVDEDTKIVYRKEQFSYDNSFPKELIVRDRRYYMNEITEMCISVGFKVIQKRFVNAGWQNDYDAISKKAKEILLVCKKDVSL